MPAVDQEWAKKVEEAANPAPKPKPAPKKKTTKKSG